MPAFSSSHRTRHHRGSGGLSSRTTASCPDSYPTPSMPTPVRARGRRGWDEGEGTGTGYDPLSPSMPGFGPPFLELSSSQGCASVLSRLPPKSGSDRAERPQSIGTRDEDLRARARNTVAVTVTQGRYQGSFSRWHLFGSDMFMGWHIRHGCLRTKARGSPLIHAGGG